MPDAAEKKKGGGDFNPVKKEEVREEINGKKKAYTKKNFQGISSWLLCVRKADW